MFLKIIKIAKEVVREGMDPVEAIEKGLAKSIRELGKKFERGFVGEKVVIGRVVKVLSVAILMISAKTS